MGRICSQNGRAYFQNLNKEGDQGRSKRTWKGYIRMKLKYGSTRNWIDSVHDRDCIEHMSFISYLICYYVCERWIPPLREEQRLEIFESTIIYTNIRMKGNGKRGVKETLHDVRHSLFRSVKRRLQPMQLE